MSEGSFLLTLMMLFIALLVGAIWGVFAIAEHSCHTTAQRMGLPYSYSIMTDCMVQVDGQWLPLSNYRFLGHRDANTN